jgi:hypothetical protein
MKALNYLMAKGVTPSADRNSLISTIVWLSPGGRQNLAIYPDCQWIDIPEKRALMFALLDGEINCLYNAMVNLPTDGLIGLLETTMDLRCYNHGLEKRVGNLTEVMGDTRQWANLWNSYIGLSPDEEGSWDHKAEIILAYSVENRWEKEAKPIVEALERERVEYARANFQGNYSNSNSRNS